MLTKMLKKYLLVTALFAVLGWAGFSFSENDVSKAVDNVVFEKNFNNKPKEAFNDASLISPKRRAHILYGDATGGGHLYGTGKACKSEFPKNWNEDTIIKEIKLIAANDNLNWKKQNNGYYVAEQQVGTVNVRVIKGRQNKQIITAYPTNTPRNPCPANDN